LKPFPSREHSVCVCVEQRKKNGSNRKEKTTAQESRRGNKDYDALVIHGTRWVVPDGSTNF
jgi:hypothetical protein